MNALERVSFVNRYVAEAMASTGKQRISGIRSAQAVLSAWGQDEQVALGLSPHIPLVFLRDEPLTEDELRAQRPTPSRFSSTIVSPRRSKKAAGVSASEPSEIQTDDGLTPSTSASAKRNDDAAPSEVSGTSSSKWCRGAREDHSTMLGNTSAFPAIANKKGADCRGCGRFVAWHRDGKRLRPHLPVRP